MIKLQVRVQALQAAEMMTFSNGKNRLWPEMKGHLYKKKKNHFLCDITKGSSRFLQVSVVLGFFCVFLSYT